jgi:hypothetical protein
MAISGEKSGILLDLSHPVRTVFDKYASKLKWKVPRRK